MVNIKGHKKHSKNKNKVTKIGDEPKSKTTPHFTIKSLEEFENIKSKLIAIYSKKNNEPDIIIDRSQEEIKLPFDINDIENINGVTREKWLKISVEMRILAEHNVSYWQT